MLTLSAHLMPQVLRLRDVVYHKEEALWLARKEIRDRDEHIHHIEQEFNDLQKLLIQLEGQAAHAAPESESDHANGTLDMQTDNTGPNVETGGQRKPGFRYMPSPPKTPAPQPEGVTSPPPPRPNAPPPSSQSASPLFSPATEKRLQEEDVRNLQEQKQMLSAMQVQAGHGQTDNSQSATTTNSTMAPVSPDVIRPTSAAPVGIFRNGHTGSGPQPLLPPGWMHVL